MLCLPVKNLPLSLNQPRLREHPEYKDGPGGTFTNIKDILKRDSTYSRSALEGYNTDVGSWKDEKMVWPDVCGFVKDSNGRDARDIIGRKPIHAKHECSEYSLRRSRKQWRTNSRYPWRYFSITIPASYSLEKSFRISSTFTISLPNPSLLNR